MNFKPYVKVIGEDQYQRIHDASLKILSEVGFRFECEEALEIFKQHGARVEGKNVYMPSTMVEKALRTVPSKFKWLARNEQNSIVLGEGYDVEPNVGCVYIQDLDNGRRAGKLEDYANVQKLHQSSTITTIVGANPIATCDIPADDQHLYMIYETVKNTDKPLIGLCVKKQHVLESFKMIELAMGKENILDDNVCIAVSVNPLSPLAYSVNTTESIIEYARKRQVVMILPDIMAGITGPVSLFGTIVAQNAEILAGIVLTQLVSPGAPVVAGPCSSTCNMKYANYISGTPDMMLIDVAGLQMFHEFYHIPTRIMTGMTDSKAVDIQAGYETMENMVMGILSGAHIIHECLGVLDAIMTLSLEKFIIDEEMLSRVFKIAEGIDVSDEAMSMDIIKEIGTSGSYITHQNTFDHFTELWRPTVSDWDPYAEWEGKGSPDILVKANKMWKERLANAPEMLIDKELDKALKAYIKSVRP
jgi:trimethylamine--corrinoid protein Co-methyltransferase